MSWEYCSSIFRVSLRWALSEGVRPSFDIFFSILFGNAHGSFLTVYLALPLPRPTAMFWFCFSTPLGEVWIFILALFLGSCSNNSRKRCSNNLSKKLHSNNPKKTLKRCFKNLRKDAFGLLGNITVFRFIEVIQLRILKGTNYLLTYFFFKKTNWVVKIFENQNPFGIL